jgi:hypothetical protein
MHGEVCLDINTRQRRRLRRAILHSRNLHLFSPDSVLETSLHSLHDFLTVHPELQVNVSHVPC